MPLKYNLIVAMSENMGIGKNGNLPWKLRKEMTYFSHITKASVPGKRNAVLMGRKTWESIPIKFRPLPERFNVVLSKTSIPETDDFVCCSSWEEALSRLESRQETIDKIWIIGGSSVYKEAMSSPNCHRIYVTRILQDFDCDTFFPPIDHSKYKLIKDENVPKGIHEEDGIKYIFEVYEIDTN